MYMISPRFILMDQLTRFEADEYSEEDLIEVIVKYNGDVQSVAAEFDAFVEILDVNYAIFTIKFLYLPQLYSFNQIEYIELPKNITYLMRESLNSSCITEVQRESTFGLTGQGVIIGIIDSGIDYTHPDFRNPDGTTRILFLWDQFIEGVPPQGFRNGSEYTKFQIDQALASGSPFLYVPSDDNVGHGTAVAGIAAGNGRSSNGLEKGVAPNSYLIVVKLGHKENASFSRTTEIMRAAKYISDKAQELGLPVCINISYGTNNGSHNGNSLFETYLNNVSQSGRCSICVASGNEASSSHHYSNVIVQDAIDTIEFAISDNIPRVYMSMWKNFIDTMSIEIISPSGKSTGVISSRQRITRAVLDNVLVSVLYGQPTHYNSIQEIYILFRGINKPISGGLWSLVVRGTKIHSGLFDIWLPTLEEVTQYTSFLRPSVPNTITLPATAQRVISVGGYNSVINSIADFSGQGTVRNLNCIKPDLTAPAVNILTTRAGGGYDTFTGTSVAAPFVTGSAALMMEWGLIQGNDPFLYGQRIKAFLCQGAEKISGVRYPSPIWGCGTLNLCNTMDSLVEYNNTGGAFL